METLHTLAATPTRRVLLVLDPDHRPEYGLDSPEETEAAERHERAMLDSGEWAALGLIVEESCPHCGAWEHVDSVWGVVVESTYPDDAFVHGLVTDHLGWTAETLAA